MLLFFGETVEMKEISHKKKWNLKNKSNQIRVKIY